MPIDHDRIADIQENLNLLYEQLAGEEKAEVLESLENRTRIQQRIRILWQKIRTKEL